MWERREKITVFATEKVFPKSRRNTLEAKNDPGGVNEAASKRLLNFS